MSALGSKSDVYCLPSDVSEVPKAEIGDLHSVTPPEVCHLAGVGSGRSLPLVHKLIEFLRASDVKWAIFAATRPLRSLLRQNRLR
jgi:hypothetical protein